MAYHYKTKLMLMEANRDLGSRLGKLAVAKGLPVMQVALLTGASRPTVYHWFSGGTVSNAYRTTVTLLINRLRTGSKEQITELQNSEAYIASLLLR
jgi:hypothetical protein